MDFKAKPWLVLARRLTSALALPLAALMPLYAGCGSTPEEGDDPSERYVEPGPERDPEPVLAGVLSERVRELIDLLRSSNEEAKRSAREELIRIGSGVAAFLAELPVESGWETRREAARVLAAVGGPQAQAMLRTMAEDPNWSVRETAMEGLRPGSGELERETLELLRRGMVDPLWRVRLAAVRALAHWPEGEGADLLRAGLEDEDPEVRYECTRIMSQRLREADLPALRCAARDPRREVRQEALQTLASRSDAASEELFRANLADESLFARIAALEGLIKVQQAPGALPREAEPVLEELVTSFLSPDLELSEPATRALRELQPLIRPWCLSWIERMAPERLEEFMPLAEEMADSSWAPTVRRFYQEVAPEVQAELLALLKKLAPGDHLSFFIEGCQSEHPVLRNTALCLLEELRPPEALPTLCRLAEAPDETIRRQAILALRGYPDEDILPLFRRLAMTETSPELFHRLAAVLARAGQTQLLKQRLLQPAPPAIRAAIVSQPMSPEAFRELFWIAMDDRAPGVRLAALEKAQQLASDEKMAQQLWDTARHDPDPEVRKTALRQAATLAPPVDCSTILPFLKDENIGVRDAAVGILARLSREPDGEDALRILCEVALGGQELLRQPAIEALAAHGGDPAVCSVLWEMAEKELSTSIRILAIDALQKIDPEELPQRASALLALDQPEEIQLALLRALGFSRHPIGEAAWLPPMIRSEDFQLALRALLLAEARQVRSATPAIIEVLTHATGVGLRQTAAEALGMLRAPEAVQPLAAALADPDEAVRRKALWALGQYRDPNLENLCEEAVYRRLRGETGERRSWLAGEDFLNLGLDRLAQSAYTQLLALEPHDSQLDLRARMRLGELYARKANLEAAWASYSAAREQLQRTSVDGTLDRRRLEVNALIFDAVHWFCEKRNLKARAALKEAAARASDEALVYNNIAWYLTQADQRLDVAAELVARALARKPDDGAILDTAGWVHYRRGEGQEALSLFERAVEQREDSGAAAYHAALAAIQLDDPDLALSWLRRAMEADRAFLQKALEEEVWKPVRSLPAFDELKRLRAHPDWR